LPPRPRRPRSLQRRDGVDRRPRCDVAVSSSLPRGQHTGRGNGAGPEPLEFYERRATGAHRPRPLGGGVHLLPFPTVADVRPRQLHGSGHVRRVAPTRRRTGVPRAVRLQPAVVHRAVRGPVEQGVLRRGVRHGTGPGAHGQRHRHGGPVRPAGHRAAGLRVRGPPGRRRRSAHGVRGADAHDHVHATVHRRPLGQSGVRAAPALRLSGPGVPAQVGQHGRVRLRPVGPVVRRADGPPPAVRRRPARQTVSRVRQQPSRHRAYDVTAPKRRTRRWNTFGPSQRRTADREFTHV